MAAAEGTAGEQRPKILDIPVGLRATGMRREFDSLGDVEVPADRYWGAQTQRSLEHFNIGRDRMPKEVYHAYGYVKKAAALVNSRAGRLPDWKGELIARVSDEVISGALDEHFPLYVFQTGSGTQSNMNVNEVIANRCIQLTGGTLGSQRPVHPNDHVNMGQSSNDTFPTAMHIAAHKMTAERTIPAMRRLRDAVKGKSEYWANVVKIGRTHLEDATPLTVGQEWSGYAGALDDAIAEVEHVTHGLLKLAMGGTAVGTGLNAPAGFGEQVAAEIARMTGAAFQTAGNKFTAQGTLDRMVRAHAGLKAAAVTLFKIANDLRWLGSGPRTGLHELILPSNEPGSSIMPGKVNPTQAEAMLMVAIQVIASDVAVTMGGAEGNFELNAFRPILISNYLHSALILADMCDHFRTFMVDGAQLNEPKLKENIDRSVMMVTALSPVIGYDRASVISHYAIDHDLTLKQAALANGVGEELFDRVVNPLQLTRGGSADLADGRLGREAPENLHIGAPSVPACWKRVGAVPDRLFCNMLLSASLMPAVLGGESRGKRAAVAVAFAGAGEAVEEVDLPGNPEGCEPGSAVLLEAGLGGVLAGPEDDGGVDLLAAFRVRYGECQRVLDRGVGEQCRLDGFWRDFLAAPVDHVFCPAAEEQVTVGVQAAQVAGAEPPAGECCGRGGPGASETLICALLTILAFVFAQVRRLALHPYRVRPARAC